MGEETSSIPMTILMVVISYILVGQYLKTNNIHILHETTFGIVAGMLIGGLFKLLNLSKYHALFRLNPNTFFELLLPLIIFAGAYNLKKKKFLHNFKYIVLFGFVSTLINYIITVSLTIGLNETGIVQIATPEGTFVKLGVKQILLQSATICATDSVAAITLISSDKYPQLFSVVFGEGMVNDAVSIILFKAVQDIFDGSNAEAFKWFTPFLLIWKFIENCVFSLFVGTTIGLLSTLAFKKFRFLSQSTTSETVFAFLMAYLGYSLCEVMQLSGVIGLLMCGIIMSHYQTYNISNLAKVTTRVTFDTMALMAEAFIYVYLGFTFWDQTTYYSSATDELIVVQISYGFTACQALIVILARYLSIYSVYWLTILFSGREAWKLDQRELSIACFAGMVRGSVAFALIETLQPNPSDITEINQMNVLQSSVLYIVVGTTLLFGTSMPFFINYKLKPKDLPKPLEEPLNLNSDSLEMESPITPKKEKSLSEAQRIIKYLDENYFKRWFIHDYDTRRKQILNLKRDIKKRDLQDIYNDAISEVGDNDEDKDTNNRFRIEVDESELLPSISDDLAVAHSLSTEWSRIAQ